MTMFKDRPAPTTVYVYYRVTGDAALATTAITAMLREVERRTGVGASLLCRCDDPTTWMEVFSPVADVETFSRVLRECEVRACIAAVVDGGKRHRECFVPHEAATRR